MKFRLIPIFLILPFFSFAQYTLPGKLTIQNSGNKPVPDAEISALWANNTLSLADGTFAVVFEGKKAGYEVRLKINKAGYEVVNKEKLRHVLLLNPETLKLYLCKKGQWGKNALKYYKINEESLTIKYQGRIEALKTKYRDQTQILSDSLYQLDKLYAGAIEMAAKLAESFAKANLDDVSDLYENAFLAFSNGKVEKAIDMLSEEALNAQYRRIRREEREGKKMIVIGQEKLMEAREALKMSIENYLLKAELLVINFQFGEAEKNYLKAIEAKPDQWESRFKYANFLYSQNRFPESITQYKTAQTHVKDSFNLSIILNNLANSLFKQNELNNASRTIKNALKIKRAYAREGDEFTLRNLAQTLNNTANILSEQGYFSQSIAYLEEARDINKKLITINHQLYEIDLVEVLNNLGNIYINQNRIQEGRKLLLDALDIVEKLKTENRFFPEQESAILSSLALAMLISNDFDAYKNYKRRSEKIRKELYRQNPHAFAPQYAFTLKESGDLLMRQSLFNEAIVEYRRSLELFLKLFKQNPKGSEENVAQLCSKLGKAFREAFQFDSSAVYLRRSLEIRKKLAKAYPESYLSELAHSFEEMAALSYDLADKEKTIAYLKRASSIFQKLTDANEDRYQEEFARVLRNLGSAYLDAELPDSGLSVTLQSLKITKSLWDEKGDIFLPELSSTHQMLMTNYSSLKEFEQALLSGKKAISGFTKLTELSPELYEDDLALNHYFIGTVYQLLKHADSALIFTRMSLPYFVNLAEKDPAVFGQNTAGILLSMSNMYNAQGYYSKARTYAIQAGEFLEEVPENPKKSLLQTLLSLLSRRSGSKKQFLASLDSVRNAQTLEEKARIQQGLVNRVEMLYQLDPQDGKLDSLLSEFNDTLLWLYIRGKDWDQAEIVGSKGLIHDPKRNSIKLKLAHAFLVNGKNEEARKLYLEVFDTIEQHPSGKSWKKAAIEELKELKKLKLIPPDKQSDFNTIKKWANQTE